MIKSYHHSIFKLLAITILLGVLASGYISWQRYKVEAQATTVEMVYDYNNILESASIENTSTDELFSLYKKSGITSLAIYDETLKKLMDHGHVVAYHGTELIPRLSNPLIRGDRIYIEPAKTSEGIAYFNELKYQLKHILHEDNFKVIYLNDLELLEVNANYERFLAMPLGIFKNTVHKAEKTGFYLVLRPVNIPHATREDIDRFLSVTDSSERISAVLFQGKEVLGYPGQLDYLMEGLQKRNLPVVLVEAQNQLGFERQDGSVALAEKSGYNAIRLYAMSKDELIKLDAKEASSRFYISTIERNIRMNLFPSYKFAANGETLSETNARYINDVTERLLDHGFNIGKASVMEPYQPSKILRAAAMVGATSLCVLVLLFLVPFLIRYSWFITAVAILLTQGLYWIGYESLIRQILALGCAVGTPVIVMTLFMDYCIRKKESAFNHIGWGRLFIESVISLWVCGLLSLLGAAYISGLLSDIRFFLEMNIFRGVKLTFILPLICVSIIYIQRFPFFGKIVVSDSDFVGFIKKFCRIDIKLGLLVVIGILGIAGFIFIGRSGNNGAPVPQFEVALRRFLEDIMYARPREKEFLLGHPAILASFMALYHRWPQILHYFFIVAVTIGQGSMVETFAHMRSPFLLSLVRGINGLAVGTLVMVTALIGFIIFTHITKYLGARYEK